MTSNTASNIPPPTMFQSNPSGTIGNVWGDINQQQGTYGGIGPSVLGPAQQTAGNLYNNPFSGQALGGAMQGAGYGEAAAPFSFGAGANLAGSGQSLIPFAQNIMQTGFDPQNQLYSRLQQQNTDQTNAMNAASGVGGTPYGAGLADLSNQNFNINWQNNLLGREATAAGAAGGLVGAGGNAINTGTGIMNQVPGQLATSAMLPYATYSGIGQGQNQALQSLLGLAGGAQGLGQVPIQDWLALLGGQTGVNQVGNQTYQNLVNANQTNWGQLGQLGQGIGSLVGAGAKLAPLLMA